ncbi:hypothetical protein B0H15DRAFT_796964 [Mycena belliarum]|uniref:Zn(2)-C6 fungal-type domain-containing protein n=1 Tax=Mycena belliarum TaxID=1033014 RepID=A0AAD6XTS9_9AGAR|nr:hypothetical protein B0H15DRAFT_796964 [Mycena belliae]
MARPLKRGRACMACRFLKIKCDGQKPICGPCRKHPKDDDCEYSDGPARSRTKALEDTVARLEARLHELEHPEDSTPAVTLHDPYPHSQYPPYPPYPDPPLSMSSPGAPPQLTISLSPAGATQSLPNTPFHALPRLLSPAASGSGSSPDSQGAGLAPLSPFSPPRASPPSPLGIFDARGSASSAASVSAATPESSLSASSLDFEQAPPQGTSTGMGMGAGLDLLIHAFLPHAAGLGFFLDPAPFCGILPPSAAHPQSHAQVQSQAQAHPALLNALYAWGAHLTHDAREGRFARRALHALAGAALEPPPSSYSSHFPSSQFEAYSTQAPAYPNSHPNSNSNSDPYPLANPNSNSNSASYANPNPTSHPYPTSYEPGYSASTQPYADAQHSLHPLQAAVLLAYYLLRTGRLLPARALVAAASATASCVLHQPRGQGGEAPVMYLDVPHAGSRYHDAHDFRYRDAPDFRYHESGYAGGAVRVTRLPPAASASAHEARAAARAAVGALRCAAGVVLYGAGYGLDSGAGEFEGEFEEGFNPDFEGREGQEQNLSSPGARAETNTAALCARACVLLRRAVGLAGRWTAHVSPREAHAFAGVFDVLDGRVAGLRGQIAARYSGAGPDADAYPANASASANAPQYSNSAQYPNPAQYPTDPPYSTTSPYSNPTSNSAPSPYSNSNANSTPSPYTSPYTSPTSPFPSPPSSHASPRQRATAADTLRLARLLLAGATIALHGLFMHASAGSRAACVAAAREVLALGAGADDDGMHGDAAPVHPVMGTLWTLAVRVFGAELRRVRAGAAWGGGGDMQDGAADAGAGAGAEAEEAYAGLRAGLAGLRAGAASGSVLMRYELERAQEAVGGV